MEKTKEILKIDDFIKNNVEKIYARNLLYNLLLLLCFMFSIAGILIFNIILKDSLWEPLIMIGIVSSLIFVFYICQKSMNKLELDFSNKLKESYNKLLIFKTYKTCNNTNKIKAASISYENVSNNGDETYFIKGVLSKFSESILFSSKEIEIQVTKDAYDKVKDKSNVLIDIKDILNINMK